jgi:hypothetical protein
MKRLKRLKRLQGYRGCPHLNPLPQGEEIRRATLQLFNDVAL